MPDQNDPPQNIGTREIIQYVDKQIRNQVEHYNQLIAERDKQQNDRYERILEAIQLIRHDLTSLHGSTTNLTSKLVDEVRYQVDINKIYERIVTLEQFMNEYKGRQLGNVWLVSIFGAAIIAINLIIDIVFRLSGK